MHAALDWIFGLAWWQAALFFVVENLVIFAATLAVGAWMVRRWGQHRVTPPAPPLSAHELWLTASTVTLNAAVTLAGWFLWREGWIQPRAIVDVFSVVDFVVLCAAMDAAMYVAHRIAHVRWLYPLIHGPHHRYEHPRPLTLFVLHPFEAMGFGAMWLALLVVYPASWAGMGAYLTLNVWFGLVGHLGVEPLPPALARHKALAWLTTSTFHAGHHDGPAHNFGFYTTLWDRLMGTLAPDYQRRLVRAAQGEPLALEDDDV
jgi:lathosterol oxidase